MKKMVVAFVTVLGLTTGASMTARGQSQDPLTLYPENYKILLENDKVRVLDFRLEKGATEKPHMHPANVAVFLADFTIRFTFPDGKTALREGHPGVVAYSDAVTHASENIGSTDAHGILIELKTPAKAAGR